MRATVYFLTLALFISNLGDFLTTFIALSLGASELNPIINSGLEIFFGVKLLLPTLYIICGLLLNSYTEKHKYKSVIVGIELSFLFVVIAFVYATINNIFVIAQTVEAGQHFRFI